MADKKLLQTLDLKQQQNLVMTPQMQQAIKLLQLNNLELQEWLETELAQNPLLEKLDPEEPESDEDYHTPTPPSPSQDDDFDAGSAFNMGTSSNQHDFLDEEQEFGANLTRPTNLRDHLMEQVAVSQLPPLDRSIATLLIDRLDEAGYLRENTQSLAEQIGCSAERLDSVLEFLRQCDPVGIFATNLQDCMMLQLQERGQWDAVMELFVTNLPLLARHDYAALSKICNVSEAAIKDMAEEVKALNPKPAALFDHVVAQTAIPDVMMKRLPKDQGGGYRVEINTATLPRVLVNQEYYTLVTTHSKDSKEREYITSQLHNANWIVKAMDQRAQTILKVASEIIERQDGFFLYGIEFMKPLTLREIAEAIDMHESTVSRVTTGKFIGTPRGLYELKFFFSSSIETADGNTTSSEAVKARIQSLIDAEGDVILSDDDLVDKLAEYNITIARRTVAKYRESLNIPSSVQRNRIRKSQA